MEQKYIRQAVCGDAYRIAEIEVFNYRLNFYPIFKDDQFYFDELNVSSVAEKFLFDETLLENTCVYDDGVVKGFIRIDGKEVKKLFVEPVLQGQSIGAKLLNYAIEEYDVNCLWALEKNTKTIKFYERHGFRVTGERIFEEGTTEYLVRMEKK